MADGVQLVQTPLSVWSGYIGPLDGAGNGQFDFTFGNAAGNGVAYSGVRMVSRGNVYTSPFQSVEGGSFTLAPNMAGPAILLFSNTTSPDLTNSTIVFCMSPSTYTMTYTSSTKTTMTCTGAFVPHQGTQFKLQRDQIYFSLLQQLGTNFAVQNPVGTILERGAAGFLTLYGY